MAPGRPACVDYEYAPNGTANLFMMFAQFEGWRGVEVTSQNTANKTKAVTAATPKSKRHFFMSRILLPRAKQSAFDCAARNADDRRALFEAAPFQVKQDCSLPKLRRQRFQHVAVILKHQ